MLGMIDCRLSMDKYMLHIVHLSICLALQHLTNKEAYMLLSSTLVPAVLLAMAVC